MDGPIRIFVGCDPNDCDLEQMMVLDHSARKHSSLPIEITWMRLSRDPASPWYCDPARQLGWRTETWSTPFSALRWAIPAACGFQGRALYLDADMLVRCDLADIWNMPMAAGTLVAARRVGERWLSCVSLWDCARARGHLPTLEALRADPAAHKKMKRLFARRPDLIHPLDARYNCVDGDGLPLDDIRILHYSDMGTQFSHRYAVPRLRAEGRTHWFDGEVLPHPRQDLAELFDRYYQEALQAGRRLDDYRNAPPFGALIKASQKDYTGNRPKPRRRNWLERLARHLAPGRSPDSREPAAHR
ncbi:glycosyl transferase [Bordetella genomosp. 10]|uniref:Glycosyl transferase n=1 Tax=Bordetella genomosp. 10 TaxID=1416804 RepID=A0A261SBB5_9BORD|nr:glycosyl transferase [Bordetella genomosp. 10]OZI34455.1 glycosyl transferase [Bordetella genomosp. 10]